MATPASGLTVHIGGTSFLTLNTASSDIASNSLTAISITQDQSVWVSSNDSGVLKKEGLIYKSYNSFNSPLPDNFVHTLITDANGIVWIGTSQSGLVRFDESLFLGVENINENNSLSLFPNPADDFVNIRLNADVSGTLVLTNSEGRTVLEKSIHHSNNTFVIDVTDLKSGIYFVQLYFDDGSVAIKKLVVVHR